MKSIAGCVFVIASLLLLGGCGGGSSTISQQDYERQLEQVCNKGLQKRDEAYNAINREYEKLSKSEQTPEVQTENLLKLIDVYAETTAEIAAIDLPEGKEEKAQELVQQREDAAAKIKANPAAARSALGTIFQKSSELAESFGAQSCVT